MFNVRIENPLSTETVMLDLFSSPCDRTRGGEGCMMSRAEFHGFPQRMSPTAFPITGVH